MQVMLDKTRCDFQVDSVEEAVAAAAAMAQKQGRMIVEIMVDGSAWDSSHPRPGIAMAKEVSLTSANPRQLACQALDQAADALREADTLQQSAAEMIQADRMKDAMDLLTRAFEIWTAVEQAVRLSAEAAGIDLIGTLTLVQSEGVIDRLNAQLKSMQAALERRDPVSLADTLLYDMPEVVVQWRGMLAVLRTHMSGSRA